MGLREGRRLTLGVRTSRVGGLLVSRPGDGGGVRKFSWAVRRLGPSSLSALILTASLGVGFRVKIRAGGG